VSQLAFALALGLYWVSEPKPLLTIPGPMGFPSEPSGGAAGSVDTITADGVSRSGMDSNEGTKRRRRLRLDIRNS
jgi:hypothetical protein